MLDLKELAQSIGERALLPTVGHELRTPLTSIRGYLETVLDGECDAPTARRFLESARRETLRLGRLIDGMLEISFLEAVAREPVCDVVEQVHATIEMLVPLARRRGVTIRSRLPQAARARMESDECLHALANLLENAIRHGGQRGLVEISCRCANGYVEFAVDDGGRGVAASERQRIFTPGARGANAERGGCGMGLAVVKAIAQRAAGEVWIEPSRLGGARFVLRVPAG